MFSGVFRTFSDVVRNFLDAFRTFSNLFQMFFGAVRRSALIGAVVMLSTAKRRYVHRSPELLRFEFHSAYDELASTPSSHQDCSLALKFATST